MQTDSQIILDKYISLPRALQQEVADFIEFLQSKYQKENRQKKKDANSVVKGKKRKSNFGSARGLIIMSADFDEPLEDFKDYM
jgi:hypothetical protein